MSAVRGVGAWGARVGSRVNERRHASPEHKLSRDLSRGPQRTNRLKRRLGWIDSGRDGLFHASHNRAANNRAVGVLANRGDVRGSRNSETRDDWSVGQSTNRAHALSDFRRVVALTGDSGACEEIDETGRKSREPFKAIRRRRW